MHFFYELFRVLLFVVLSTNQGSAILIAHRPPTDSREKHLACLLACTILNCPCIWKLAQKDKSHCILFLLSCRILHLALYCCWTIPNHINRARATAMAVYRASAPPPWSPRAGVLCPRCDQIRDLLAGLSPLHPVVSAAGLSSGQSLLRYAHAPRCSPSSLAAIPFLSTAAAGAVSPPGWFGAVFSG
jgi:hypothetical protein